MKIRITEKNQEKIERTLKAVNGKATAFATTDYKTVATIAETGKADIAKAAGAKKTRRRLPGHTLQD